MCPPADGPRAGARTVIGLCAAEQAAYELLIEHPAATLDELSAEWSRPEPLAFLLTRLEDAGAASSVPGSPTRYRPIAPGVAFEAQLNEYDDRLDQARRHAAILSAAYQARPTDGDTNTVIELVTGRRAVGQRLLLVRRGARHRIGWLVKPPELAGVGFEPEQVTRGLTCHAVYDRTAIEFPGALGTVEALIEAGQHARVLPDLPLSLCLADEKVAVVPLPARPGAPEAAIIVHPSALLDALIALFDGLWQRALPLQARPAGRREPDDGQSGPDRQRLITLLLSGFTDEAIARQLGTSHRTVQRRVAALMADLGAQTRFQVGVRAAVGERRRSQATDPSAD